MTLPVGRVLPVPLSPFADNLAPGLGCLLRGGPGFSADRAAPRPTTARPWEGIAVHFQQFEHQTSRHGNGFGEFDGHRLTKTYRAPALSAKKALIVGVEMEILAAKRPHRVRG